MHHPECRPVRGRVPLAIALTAAAGALLSSLVAAAVPAAAAPTAATPTAIPAAAKPAAASALAAGSYQRAAVDTLVTQLGITRAEATRRLRAQPAQAQLAERLSRRLGGRSGGAYVDRRTGALTITVLDAAGAAEVRAAGAVPRLVRRSPAALAGIRTALARLLSPGSAVSLDVAGNVVMVRVPAAARDRRTAALLRAAARYGPGVRVQRTPGRIQALAALHGGTTIKAAGGQCTGGFVTRNGAGVSYLLTAGHCVVAGLQWSSGPAIGPMVAASYPGNDFAAIQVTNPFWQPAGFVATSNGPVRIVAAVYPPVNSVVCKTGRFTSPATTCGLLLGYGGVLDYGDGPVYDLIATSICAKPGDSGGPVTYTNPANGVTSATGLVSGGNPNCNPLSGGFTAVQPITEPLVAFGLTLP